MYKFNRRKGNLLTCIAELLIGILLFINPVGFTSGIIIMLGVILAVSGIVNLFDCFRAAPEDAAEQGGLAKGLGLLLAGTFCMFRSNWFIVTFPLLTVIYGVLTLLGGINKVQWAIDMLRAKQKYWFVAIISAVLTLVFSALILANPFASTAVLWTFIAATLIVEAVIDIVAFILGRKSFDQAD